MKAFFSTAPSDRSIFSVSNWEEFCRQPLEEALQYPWPGLELAEELPATAEGDGAVVAQALYKRYMNLGTLVEIADRFQEWAEGRPDGESLLWSAEEGVDYWFAGDLHASFDVLVQLWVLAREQAQRDGRRACVVLLGDVIDRGMGDFPCLGMIEDMLMSGGQDGVSLLCLRGNHDAALSQDRRGNFHSSVVPAETSDALNSLRANGPAGAAESVGRAAIALARISPVVLEISQLGVGPQEATILLAHAGMPHVDQQEFALLHAADFRALTGQPLFESVPVEEREKWAEDFTWIRLLDRLSHSKPQRGFHGSRMGTEDVNTYRRLHYCLTGRAITFIIRGHDHEKCGYRLYSYDEELNPSRIAGVQKNCGVLTINTMGRTSDDPVFRAARPAVVRWRRGGKMFLYRLSASSDMS